MIRKAPNSPLERSEWRVSQSAELRESCSSLLRRLNWPDRGVGSRVLGLTSCRHGAGVTTIASHLAATAASQGGLRVLLVDFNLHTPRLHRLFAVESVPGVAEALSGERDVEMVIQSLPLENLSLMSVGAVRGDAGRLFDAQNLEPFVRDLSAQFDLVIVDMPPLGESSAATRLSACLDGVVLVVESEKTTWADATRTKCQLELASARLLGVVVNNKR